MEFGDSTLSSVSHASHPFLVISVRLLAWRWLAERQAIVGGYGDFVVASGRYTVPLHGPEGRLVKVRLENVQEEEEDEGEEEWTGDAEGGGGGKMKKGAGKKGFGPFRLTTISCRRE